MKVFNLKCENDHVFEGWFASADGYARQQADGLLECPVCATPAVRRMPSAARLNLSGARESVDKAARGRGTDSSPGSAHDLGQEPPQAPAQISRQMVAQPTAAQLHKLWLRMASLVQSATEDVGDRFAEEARRIHYNEAPERGIRGIATPEEAEELADEGIDVIAFPMPASDKGPVQ